MGKAGVGVVLTLSAPASGTVSFDVGSAPYVVDVFATDGEQIPPQIDLWGSAWNGSSAQSPAPHDGDDPGSCASRAGALPAGGQRAVVRRRPPVPGGARRARLHRDRLSAPAAMRTAEAADDRALVAAAQAGDRNALDTLLRRHYDRVHAICRRIAGSSRDADDAAQEAMISIVRGLARFDGRAAFSTWTYRIATNAALDELRKRDRRPAPHVDADGSSPGRRRCAVPTGGSTASPIAWRSTRRSTNCPRSSVLAVVLRDLCDLDYAEIAGTLDVPVGTVKSRIARGRSLLAGRLGNPAPSAERPSATPPHESTDDG